MSLQWIDGFDHYDGVTANLTQAGYTFGSQCTISATSPRNGSYSLRLGTGSNGQIQRFLKTARQTVGIGFGLIFPSLNDSPFLSTSTSISMNTSGPNLAATSLGAIQVLRARTGTVLATSAPGVLQSNVYQHIEVKMTASNTAGAIEVKVNGVTVVAISGVDTIAAGDELIHAFRIESAFGSYAYIDDLFVWDTTGTTNNDFLGDRKVVTINPSDATSIAEWTTVGAASSVAAISSNDGDTSYISAGDSVPITSEFELTNPDSTVGAIAGVMIAVCARKVESGTVIIKPSMVMNSSATDNGDHSISDQYAYYSTIHELNPESGAPWTVSTLSSAKLRVRRTA